MKLTRRQLDVLRLAAVDVPNKNIADRLGVSLKTIQSHRYQICRRLNIHSGVMLTHYALHNKLVPNLFEN